MCHEPVRWGILSTAAITERALIPALRESVGAELVAIASRDGERAGAAATRHAIPTAYGAYEELLADERVEAIYVPLPNSLHIEWSIRALEAGKHVLCEKPMDKDPAEVARAFDAAERADRLLTEALMWRHHVDTVAMSELVAGGAIGTPRHVQSSFAFPIPEGPDIRFAPQLDGGSLMDLACYPVSALRLFAGEPSMISANWSLGTTGVDESIMAMFTFAGGVTGALFASFNAAPASAIEVFGSERTLVMKWPFVAFRPAEIELRSLESTELVPTSNDNRYRRMVDNFNEAIRGDAKLLLRRDDAVAQARAIAAMRQSALQAGAPIRL